MLYDWRGPGIWVAENVGTIWLAFCFLLNRVPTGWHLAPLFIAIVGYMFLRICALIKWYNGYPRHAGIGRQFQIGMVPGSYLILILAIATWWNIGWLMIIVALLYILVAHVNVYLLIIHFQDRDKTPPELYSGISR